jgi:hypothetical protein
MLNFMLLLGGDADARDKQGRTPLDMCDDQDARKVIKEAYKKQGDLRVERWGSKGVPPPREGEKPVTILEQAIKVRLSAFMIQVSHVCLGFYSCVCKVSCMCVFLSCKHRCMHAYTQTYT